MRASTALSQEYPMGIAISPTRDPRLLDDYYALREKAFRQELAMPDFDGGEDAWDLRSDILIIRRGNTCLGGARITIGNAGGRRALPIEAAGLDLAGSLRALALGNCVCAQVSRLTIAERERTPTVLQAMAQALINHALEQDCAYLLGVSGMVRSRMFRRMFSMQGLSYDIRPDIPVPVVPPFDRLPHFLGIAALRPSRPAHCTVTGDLTLANVA
jgi:hypothetical protein